MRKIGHGRGAGGLDLAFWPGRLDLPGGACQMRTRPAILCLFLTLAPLPLRANDTPPAPAEWRFQAARDEIAPRHEVSRDDAGGYALTLTGNGQPSVDGRFVRRVPVTAGGHVLFTARYQAKDVATPTRSVVSSILWFDAKG